MREVSGAGGVRRRILPAPLPGWHRVPQSFGLLSRPARSDRSYPGPGYFRPRRVGRGCGMTLTRHRLSSAQFEALAGGAGDTAGELRSGQLSRCVLQIVTLLGEISARRPDTFVAGGFRDSYGTLAAARRRSQPAV